MKIPDRYVFSGKSIKGGMGEVRVYSDTHLEREVVLKILKNGEDQRRLLDEQKALLQLRSKHVVQLYDIVEIDTDSSPKKALVLEYINGADLEFGIFDVNVRYLTVLWQISCGLAEIHEAGIIHRDIKPANMRLDESGVLKIFDFGLSRNFGADAHTISAIGTPVFMAPELWKKTNVSFDQAVDVYAFAITALCLLKGASAPSELSEFPPKPIASGRLSTSLRGLSNEIIELLESCLRHDPSERPTSAVLESVLKRHLLKGKHRALLVANGKTYELHSNSANANVSIEPLGAIGINYNGLQFIVTSKSGTITVNNKSIEIGYELPACCVITFGASSSRRFITFDVSNPEVLP